MKRKNTLKVNVGGIPIGGGSFISVQSMTKTKTSDYNATIEQIKRLESVGCDIVRVTVNDKEAADAMPIIVKSVNIPVVADIHFNHIFALKSIDAGVSKVRINPGNIGNEERIKEVLTKAKERKIPIRIGVNSGSLEKDILEKYGYPTAEALYESAMRHVKICEKYDFNDIVISVKSTDVKLMIEAYRYISEETNYPLHLGVTEAGTTRVGTIKSAIGIGTLLAEGIGDTIRVSLTDEPEKEVEVGKEILKALNLKQGGVNLIVCPTCGRLEVDLFPIVHEIEEKVKNITKPISVAILGCAVNGIGEAAEADIGIACGKGEGILFIKGKIIKKIPESEFVSAIMNEIEKI
ncbi:MAG TPA: flavodoxin-dependent (E)-4-hydroxy-3-methylbut-2-enyl-diphosphate synthase [Bacteroidota bacterium]|nr:flavodoxin-dependent (E)-4-hydroxy-3-methylbut-2-enyl-diphosphate synthase [Bacteroidota bacterium]